MRAEVAGVELDLGHAVIVFDLWEPLPVTFHRWELRRLKEPDEDGATVQPSTGCGIPTTHRETLVGDATPLPPRTALRIGRPCRRCWPELRSVLPLWQERALFR